MPVPARVPGDLAVVLPDSGGIPGNRFSTGIRRIPPASCREVPLYLNPKASSSNTPAGPFQVMLRLIAAVACLMEHKQQRERISNTWQEDRSTSATGRLRVIPPSKPPSYTRTFSEIGGAVRTNCTFAIVATTNDRYPRRLQWKGGNKEWWRPIR